jgi:hypothetical protein
MLLELPADARNRADAGVVTAALGEPGDEP